MSSVDLSKEYIISDETESWAQKLADANIITDREKFLDFIDDNMLQLQVDEIEVAVYKNQREYVRLDAKNKDIYTCCRCEGYFSCPMIADPCDECHLDLCYDCLMGNNPHEPCKNRKNN